MPSIAGFVRELLSEDKYGTEYMERIDERVQTLNAAQLQGLYNHLTKTANESRSKLWKDANNHLILKIKDVLAERVKAANEEKKIVQEARLKRSQKRRKQKESYMEQERVRQMIEKKAHDDAEKEVMEAEYQRQTAEKVAIMRQIVVAEDRRDFLWKVIVFVYFCLFGAIIAIFAVLFPVPIYITIAALFLITIVCLILAYRTYLLSIIKPIVIAPEYIEGQIEAKAEAFKKQQYQKIRDKERRFLEQERMDKKERKRAHAEKLRKQQEEIRIVEEARLTRIAMTKEVRAKEVLMAAADAKSLSANHSFPVDNFPETNEEESNKQRPETSNTQISSFHHEHVSELLDLEEQLMDESAVSALSFEEEEEVDDDESDFFDEEKAALSSSHPDEVCLFRASDDENSEFFRADEKV